MIINTVVLFLRDLLPVFILLCYLIVFFEPRAWMKPYGISGLVLGVIGTLFFFVVAEIISEWFEGAGIEILRVFLIFVTYLSLLISVRLFTKQQYSRKEMYILVLGIAAFLVVKGSAFLIFFDVYMQQKDNVFNIFIGCFVGLGICISFSALFIFLLTELKQKKLSVIVNVLWYLFLAGQLSHVIAYLSQVDLMEIGTPLFNLEHFIKDSSEYGHILNALFGYESSPSKTFIFVYCIAFMLPLIINNSINLTIKKSAEKINYE